MEVRNGFKLKFVKLGLVFSVLFIMSNLFIPAESYSQKPVCVYCGTDLPNGVHARTCPYYINTSNNTQTNSSSTYSPEVQLANDVLQPVIQNFFNWLFSEPAPQNRQEQQQLDNARQNEEYKKAREEYKKQVLIQITNAKDEFEIQKNKNFKEQQKLAADDMKNRVAKSEAIKSVKLANCSAFQSLKATKFVLDGITKNSENSAETERRLSEFTNSNQFECPEIKYDVAEVTTTQKVSFQELYYQYIEHQSDSIKKTLEVLNYNKANNDRVIEEKKQKVEEVTKVIEKIKVEPSTNNTDDQLLKDAMKELELSNNELQTAEELNLKMKEEIELKEKNVSTLDNMRKLYDKEEEKTTPGQ
jgi:hypothetical protein